MVVLPERLQQLLLHLPEPRGTSTEQGELGQKTQAACLLCPVGPSLFLFLTGAGETAWVCLTCANHELQVCCSAHLYVFPHPREKSVVTWRYHLAPRVLLGSY